MHARTALLLALLFIGLGLLITQCPANRDGMPGQLSQSMQETTAAARSGAFALDLWTHGKSTPQVAGVQLSDARDDVVKAYKGIAELKADDPVDIRRQQMLTRSMTDIIARLNAASAVVRGVTADPAPAKARTGLIASADALESGYR